VSAALKGVEDAPLAIRKWYVLKLLELTASLAHPRIPYRVLPALALPAMRV
jgi:hypothetical protein